MADNNNYVLPPHLRELYGITDAPAERRSWPETLKQWAGEAWDKTKQAAKDTTRIAGRGFQEVQPGLWQTAANAAGKVEKLGRDLEPYRPKTPEVIRKLQGEAAPEKDEDAIQAPKSFWQGGKPVSEALGKQAHEWENYLTEDSPKNREDQAALDRAGVAGKLLKSVFSAGPEVIKYHAGGRLLGAASMPTLDALAHSHEGRGEELKGALHGAAMHKVLSGVAPYNAPTRMAAAGGYAGAQALAEGGTAEDAAIGALTMGALAGEGGGKAGLVKTWQANRADAKLARKAAADKVAAAKNKALFEEAARIDAHEQVDNLAERAKRPALPAPEGLPTPGVINLPANLAHEKRIAQARREVESGVYTPRAAEMQPELRETRPGVFEAEEFAPPMELREPPRVESEPDYRNYGRMPADVEKALNKGDREQAAGEAKERQRLARQMLGLERVLEREVKEYKQRQAKRAEQDREIPMDMETPQADNNVAFKPGQKILYRNKAGREVVGRIEQMLTEDAAGKRTWLVNGRVMKESEISPLRSASGAAAFRDAINRVPKEYRAAVKAKSKAFDDMVGNDTTGRWVNEAEAAELRNQSKDEQEAIWRVKSLARERAMQEVMPEGDPLNPVDRAKAYQLLKQRQAEAADFAPDEGLLDTQPKGGGRAWGKDALIEKLEAEEIGSNLFAKQKPLFDRNLESQGELGYSGKDAETSSALGHKGVEGNQRARGEEARLEQEFKTEGQKALRQVDDLITTRQNPFIVKTAVKNGLPEDVVLRMLDPKSPAGEEMRVWGREHVNASDAEFEAGISEIVMRHADKLMRQRGAAAPDAFVAPLVNVEEVRKDVSRIGKAIEKVWKFHKPVEAVREVVNTYDAGHRQAEYQAAQDGWRLMELIPDKALREQIPYLAEKAKAEGKAIEDVLPLVAHDGWRFMRQRFDQLHRVMVELHPDVGFVQDYISRIWDKPHEVFQAWDAELAAKPQSQTRLMQTSGHEKTRAIPSLEWGLAHGFTPKTTDVASLLQNYERSVLTQLNRFRSFNSMYKAGMVLPADLAPQGKGWRRLDDPTLTKHLPDYSNGWSVAPEAADAVRVMTDRGFSGPVMKAALATQAFYKRSVFDLSGFHLVALAKSTAAAPSMALPWKIHENYKRFRRGDPIVREAIDAGVTLNSPYDVGAELLDGLVGSLHKGAKGLGKRVPILKPLELGTWALGKVSRGTQFVLWDWAYTGFKVGSYEKFRDDLTAKYGDRYDQKTIREWAAEATNDFFGGINQTRLMRSKSFQQGARLILNAPDWAEANFRSVFGVLHGVRDIKRGQVGQGIKDTWARGHIYRKYWRNVALALWTIGSAINYKNTEDETGEGKVLGENPGDRAWDVYIGKDDAGQDKYLDIFGFLKDNYRMMQDPAHFLYSKLAGAPKVVADVITNENWRGETIAPEYLEPEEKAAAIAGHVGKSFLPISVQSQLDVERTGQSRGEALASSFGFPIKGQRYNRWFRMKKDLMNEKAQLRKYIATQGKRLEKTGDPAHREKILAEVKRYNEHVNQMLLKAAELYPKDEIGVYKGWKDTPPEVMDEFMPAFVTKQEINDIYGRSKERGPIDMNVKGL